ncbi:MAG: pentapeptide repeat-containing protein [Ktedonobacteraceae bacterium]
MHYIKAMIDYLIDGKTRGALNPYALPLNDGYVPSTVYDAIRLTNKIAKRCVFIDVALKEADIEGCDFSYSTFINCYFRGARFKSVNLTGCTFHDCNFRGATLVNCTLSYSKWRDTYISKDMVLANLPSYPNVAQELLVNMRTNASSIGQFGDARAYLYKSESLSRSHLTKIVTRYSAYYKKYTLGQRLSALLQLSRSYVERFFWGYGEKPGTLALSAAVIITAFAFYYWPVTTGHFGDAEKLSAQVFVGNIFTLISADKHQDISWARTIEALFGIVFIGFLAASLHRRIATRKE